MTSSKISIRKKPAVSLPNIISVQGITETTTDKIEAVLSFQKGTAPGRSSIRFEHLKEAFHCPVPAFENYALNSFTELVDVQQAPQYQQLGKTSMEWSLSP